MQKKFITNLAFLIFLNLLIKPFWVLGIGVSVQKAVGPEAYGVYFTMLNFSFLFQIILDFGINNFQNRNVSQKSSAASQLLTTLALVKLALAGIFIGLIFTVGKFLMHYPSFYLYLLLVIGVNQILLSLLLFVRANLAGLQLFKIDSVVSVLDRVLMIGICGVLLWTSIIPGKFQIEWFAYAQTAAYAGTLIFALIALLMQKNLHLQLPQWAVVPQVLKESLPFALLTLIMTIYYRVDAIMIEHMMPNGAVQAGIYAQGYRLPEMASMFAVLFATLLLPMFSKMIFENKNIYPLMSLAFRLLLAPAILIAFIMNFYGLEITQMVFLDKIPETAQVQTILTYTFIPLASTYVFGTLITANGSLKLLNWISLAGVLVNVISNYFFIQKMGVTGAAWATLFTQSVVVLLQLGAIRKIFDFEVKNSLLGSLFVYSSGLWILGYLLEIYIEIPFYEFLFMAVFGILWAFISKLIQPKSIFNLLRSTE